MRNNPSFFKDGAVCLSRRRDRVLH